MTGTDTMPALTAPPNDTNIRLGHLDRRALQTLARRRLPLWDASEPLPDVPKARQRQMASRLMRGGYLDRIERGLYRVVPLTGASAIDPIELVGAWFAPEPHAIVGPAAAEYHGLILDTPTTVGVQLARPKPRDVVYQRMRYQFTTAARNSVLADNIDVITGRVVTHIASPGKLLVLLLAQPRTGRFAGRDARLATEIVIRGAATDIWKGVNWPSLIMRHGNRAVARRLAFLLEQNHVDGFESLRPLVGNAEITNFSTAHPAVGPVLNRWRLRVNDPALLGAGVE